jgi:gas vesicle protein
MNTTKVAVGVLAGLAVGALVGILFAPYKGCQTTIKISKKGSDSINDVKDKFEELLTQITH